MIRYFCIFIMSFKKKNDWKWFKNLSLKLDFYSLLGPPGICAHRILMTDFPPIKMLLLKLNMLRRSETKTNFSCVNCLFNVIYSKVMSIFISWCLFCSSFKCVLIMYSEAFTKSSSNQTWLITSSWPHWTYNTVLHY